MRKESAVISVLTLIPPGTHVENAVVSVLTLIPTRHTHAHFAGAHP